MSGSDAKLFVEVFVTLFVIMDPPGTIPLFLNLTSGRTPAMRKRLAGQAVLVAFFVITVFALFGQSILTYLGITLPAMQAAGGLLLLLVALELLTGKADEPVETTNVNVALVPLGTPLLAGPGAIVATIVFVQRVDDAWEATALAAGIVASLSVRRARMAGPARVRQPLNDVSSHAPPEPNLPHDRHLLQHVAARADRPCVLGTMGPINPTPTGDMVLAEGNHVTITHLYRSLKVGRWVMPGQSHRTDDRVSAGQTGNFRRSPNKDEE